jgi:hypothetical protein
MTPERFHGKILLESKEALKKRGVSSPDEADALSFTFARKVASGVIRNGRKIKVINNSHSRKRMGLSALRLASAASASYCAVLVVWSGAIALITVLATKA